MDVLGKLNQLTLSGEQITSEREGRSLNRERFEQDKKEFGMDYALKVRELADKKTEADAKKKAEEGDQSGYVEILNNKIGLIDDLLDSSGLDSRVGPSSLSRRAFSIKDKFGAGQEFAAGVNQLVNKETIDTLVDLKERGGTLGALSDQERILLQSAATKIGSWEMRDDKGNGTGEWNIDETSFKQELNTIKKLAKKALEKAGGTSNLQEDDIQQITDMFVGGDTAGGSFDPQSYYK